MNIKENRYDDDVFFNRYKEMDRFVQGLEGAGEWSQLKQLFPNFEGKRILDLECGYGWHCICTAQQKTTSVHDTDILRKTLITAEEKSRGCAITYQHSAMEDLQFPRASFDVVISSLIFHYIKDSKQLATTISTWLTSRGSFIFSVECPIFIAYDTQNWYYAENGEILHLPVDDYCYEGKREMNSLGEGMIKYHHILTTCFDTLLCNGFKLQYTIEPQPPRHMLDIEGTRDEIRGSITLLVVTTKRQS